MEQKKKETTTTENVKRKKKILITTDTFFPKKDGVTRFLDVLIPELAHKYELKILAPSYSGKEFTEKFHGVDTVRFPVSNLFSIAGYPAVKATPGKLKPYVNEADIVWINSASSLGASAIIAAKKLNKPVIAYLHSLEWEQLTHIVMKYKIIKKMLMFALSKLGKYLYNKCDLLMVSSKIIAEEAGRKGITTRKVIVPLGVECDKFIPPESRAKAKEKIGINQRFAVVGYCGRISNEKDIPTLAKAFSRLQDSSPNVFLLIVGDGRKEDITKYVKKNYKITGFVSNVIPYLQAMDIFVLPSLTETTSLATLEAMSCGAVPIATKVGAVPEYIENEFNGFIFPKENVDILCVKMKKLAKDSALRNKMGMLARETVIRKHSWEKTVVKIDRVLGRF